MPGEARSPFPENGPRDPEHAPEVRSAEAFLFQRITGRYEQFRQAAERVRSGQWTSADLEQFLVQIAELLAHKGQDCRAFIVETGYREEAPDEVEQGLDGMDLYEWGIQEMWQYLEDGDLGHLEEGLRFIWDGNEKINEAMRLNRESREDLDVSFIL